MVVFLEFVLAAVDEEVFVVSDHLLDQVVLGIRKPLVKDLVEVVNVLNHLLQIADRHPLLPVRYGL